MNKSIQLIYEVHIQISFNERNMVIIMTIQNIKEAAEAVKAVEQIAKFRALLDETSDGAKLEMRSRCGALYRNNNDITLNEKAIDFLKIMLDAFVTRYEEKFSELGLALDPPATPKTENIGKTVWDELED